MKNKEIGFDVVIYKLKAVTPGIESRLVKLLYLIPTSKYGSEVCNISCKIF